MADNWFKENLVAFVDEELSAADMEKFQLQLEKDSKLRKDVDEHQSMSRFLTYAFTPENPENATDLSLARMEQRFLKAARDEDSETAVFAKNSIPDREKTDFHSPPKREFSWLPYMGVSGIAASLMVVGFFSMDTFSPRDNSGLGNSDIYRGLISDTPELDVDSDGFGVGIAYLERGSPDISGILENSPFKLKVLSPITGKLDIFEVTNSKQETLLEKNINVIRGEKVTLPGVDAFTITDMKKITFKFIFNSSDTRIEKIKTFEIISLVN